MSEIRVEHLAKSFGSSRVLDDVSFTVKDKEFVTLLGPSGCGKTTTLMSIAGFQTPDAGRITCGDETFYDGSTRINRPAERRNLGIVFQSYAIWPHMTVAGNVGFPLKVRRIGKRAIRDRVAEVLELVEMGGHAGRYPHELSGGQQQRVALARAIACSPGVLLLDEPFSSLDAKLRERARARLKDLQRGLGLSTVFVTHDQDEALSMSDRVLVMNSGRILRSGTPEEVYREPGTRFVAEFLGQCNFLTGRLTRGADGTRRLITPEFPDGIVVPGNEPSTQEHNAQEHTAQEHTAQEPEAQEHRAQATIAVRPEDIVVIENPAQHRGPEPAVLDVSYLGDHYQYRFAVGGIQLIALCPHRLGTGAVQLHIPPNVARLVR